MDDNYDYYEQIINQTDKGEIIPEGLVQKILIKLGEILYSESNILYLQSPLNICGDVHGQYEDVKNLFSVSEGFETEKYLFMGDYVDRGYYSLNTFLLLATLKIKYPYRFFLLRGNHETRALPTYGFYNEVLRNYGSTSLWAKVNEIFDLLPLCAVIDNNVFAVHGGLSPSLWLISMLDDVDRFQDIPEKGIVSDITWSDPDDSNIITWRENTTRKHGYFFGETPTMQFCHINKIRLITRSHQFTEMGYRYFFRDPKKIPEGRLLLLFSAPNYGYQRNNDGAIMKYNFEGRPMHHILTYEPVPDDERIPRQSFNFLNM